MDFRLVQKKSNNFLLRDILAFDNRWVYYGAMFIDPVLRLSWILHVIFTHNIQHSGVVSFLIALIEVIRRAIWIAFRVENEQCINIAHNKASRDVPVPYNLDFVRSVGVGSVSSVAGISSAAIGASTPLVEAGLRSRRSLE
jgi:xenotropic and polytropic retrovirus receptor 1